MILDLRAEGPPQDVLAARYKTTRHPLTRALVPVLREQRTIDAVVLHQMACTLGGPTAEKRHRRALRISAHASAFFDGTVVLPCDLRAYAYHADALNARSLGVEIEGLHPGLEDDPATVPDEAKRTTWGGEPDEVTPLLIETARSALTAIVTEARAIGCPVRYVFAHRQSSPTRRSDPGQTLWREVGLWSVQALGLQAQPAATFAKTWKPWTAGKPIPREWDPVSGAKY